MDFYMELIKQILGEEVFQSLTHEQQLQHRRVMRQAGFEMAYGGVFGTSNRFLQANRARAILAEIQERFLKEHPTAIQGVHDDIWIIPHRLISGGTGENNAED